MNNTKTKQKTKQIKSKPKQKQKNKKYKKLDIARVKVLIKSWAFTYVSDVNWVLINLVLVKKYIFGMQKHIRKISMFLMC